MDFVSVERVVEMLRLEQESSRPVKPPAWWPSFNGDVVFKDVTIRYAPQFDPALTSISLSIKAGSNTAIIGRTGQSRIRSSPGEVSLTYCFSFPAGSGKSTLALALLATSILAQTHQQPLHLTNLLLSIAGIRPHLDRRHRHIHRRYSGSPVAGCKTPSLFNIPSGPSCI